jgi:hypothetical protein
VPINCRLSSAAYVSRRQLGLLGPVRQKCFDYRQRIANGCFRLKRRSLSHNRYRKSCVQTTVEVRLFSFCNVGVCLFISLLRRVYFVSLLQRCSFLNDVGSCYCKLVVFSTGHLANCVYLLTVRVVRCCSSLFVTINARMNTADLYNVLPRRMLHFQILLAVIDAPVIYCTRKTGRVLKQ